METHSEKLRRYLKREGLIHPYGFFKILQKGKPHIQYYNVRRMFWMLKKAGLIRIVRVEKGKGRIPKNLYGLVEKGLNNSLWHNPENVFKRKQY